MDCVVEWLNGCVVVSMSRKVMKDERGKFNSKGRDILRTKTKVRIGPLRGRRKRGGPRMGKEKTLLGRR